MIFRFTLGLAVALALLEPAAFAADPGAPIRERFADSQTQPSFQKHVLPLMSKLGCSGRACHGSFQGQAVFASRCLATISSRTTRRSSSATRLASIWSLPR